MSAELPGLDEKDVHVGLVNGVLAIAGEKKTETEDRERLFSERHYGRFERRIPVEDVDEDKISAAFKNGGADGHVAEGCAGAVQGEAHRDQWQISERELFAPVPALLR